MNYYTASTFPMSIRWKILENLWSAGYFYLDLHSATYSIYHNFSCWFTVGFSHSFDCLQGNTTQIYQSMAGVGKLWPL